MSDKSTFGKRALRGLLSLLIVFGVVLALWPLGQNAYAVWSQRQLRNAWPDTTQNPKPKAQSPKTQSPKVPKSPKPKTRARDWPPTRLVIPEIGLDVVVVQGLSDAALRRGPGHDPLSVLPGERGNCVIAGHRNVYGSYFRRVDELWAGSLVQLRTPDETFDYHVTAVFTVADSDVTVRQPLAGGDAPARLTLITCTIPHTSNRIIVTAEMSDDETS